MWRKKIDEFSSTVEEKFVKTSLRRQMVIFLRDCIVYPTVTRMTRIRLHPYSVNDSRKLKGILNETHGIKSVRPFSVDLSRKWQIFRRQSKAQVKASWELGSVANRQPANGSEWYKCMQRVHRKKVEIIPHFSPSLSLSENRICICISKHQFHFVICRKVHFTLEFISFKVILNFNIFCKLSLCKQIFCRWLSYFSIFICIHFHENSTICL